MKEHLCVECGVAIGNLSRQRCAACSEARRKAYAKEYYQQHREHIKAASRAARQRKLAHYRARNREWNKAHPEQVNEYRRRYREEYS